jgi:hypothetical protein
MVLSSWRRLADRRAPAAAFAASDIGEAGGRESPASTGAPRTSRKAPPRRPPLPAPHLPRGRPTPFHRDGPSREKKSRRYTFIYTYTGQRPSMLVVAIGIVLGSTTARILLGGPRGPGSKAWIKRCDYHKSRGDPVALSSHQVATSSLTAHPTTKVLATLQEKTKDEERRPRRTSMEHEEPLPPPAHG